MKKEISKGHKARNFNQKERISNRKKMAGNVKISVYCRHLDRAVCLHFVICTQITAQNVKYSAFCLLHLSL